MNQPKLAASQLNRIQIWSLVVGALGLVVCLLGVFLDTRQFFQSYLFALLTWTGVGVSCIAIVMLYHLVGGGWGFPIQRMLEAGAMTLPLMALLFVPLLAFGLPWLYQWANPAAVAADPKLLYKSPYLNVPFFIIRTVVYFAIWIAMAALLRKWSSDQDYTDNPRPTYRLRRLSGVGLVVFFLTVSAAAIDWAMSLEPDWYSTVYGVLFIAGPTLGAMALVTLGATLLANHKPLSEFISPQQFNDLGNFLLLFVIFWAYIGFSQLIVIWSGNLVDEIPWYLHRTAGGWRWIVIFLVVFQFALPFLLLLSRATKRTRWALGGLSAVILLVYLVDRFWLVMPAFYQDGLHIHWLDIAAVLGVGGLWVATFVWLLKRRPLVPVRSPFLEAAQHPEVYHHG